MRDAGIGPRRLIRVHRRLMADVQLQFESIMQPRIANPGGITVVQSLAVILQQSRRRRPAIHEGRQPHLLRLADRLAPVAVLLEVQLRQLVVPQSKA